MNSGNLSQLRERLHVKFVGGRLCLDFVNTVGGRAAGAVIRDKIAGYDDLLNWSRLAGSLDARAARILSPLAAQHEAEAAAVFDRAMRLREALYRIFRCAHRRRRPSDDDSRILRSELAIARMNQQLTMHAGRFTWTLPPRPAALDHLLWPVALSAAELLTSEELTCLRECCGADCGWLFLDTSRNRRRRWCDMRDCGNRAKVQRYRAKTRY